MDMDALPNKAVCFLLFPVPLGSTTPLYLVVFIDTDDEAQRGLFWKLRALYQQHSYIRTCSQRYFLLVITLDGKEEAA